MKQEKTIWIDEYVDIDSCDHENKEYQAREEDTNTPEDYYCLDCGKQFDIPDSL